ncbi:MAG TPA: hypothetical protein VIY49_10935 [Bryobacteraceae bacterium]
MARATGLTLTGLTLTKLRALIELHETTLFRRAFPRSAREARDADRILFSFADRLRGVDPEPFDDPKVSGIAGTTVSSNFSYEFARSLVDRHHTAISIDWDNYERPDRLGSILALSSPSAMEDYAVAPHVDWRARFERARCTPRWLLEHADPRTYDLLEIPISWNLGNSDGSRSRLRLACSKMFYHREPVLKRADVSLEAEFASPSIRIQRLGPRASRNVLGAVVDASASRYRELYGFLHPDPAGVYYAPLGRGVDLYFFRVAKEHRLPLRDYHSGMYFKNGVPTGYFEALSRAGTVELGFNLYYTFRQGETAWLFARILKLLREQLDVAKFSVDSYQLGKDNEEAIESGAFWFYRKLGFEPASSPASSEVRKLVAREEARTAANPSYRTPAAELRKLAAVPLQLQL